MADKDIIHGSVRHEGATYGPGDEEAFGALGLEKPKLQRLADKGVISGFGTKAGGSADDADTKAAPPAKKAAGKKGK